MTVTQTGANVVGQKISDGTDTLRNMEQVKFSNTTISISPPRAATGVTAAASASGTVRLTFTQPDLTTAGITRYEVVATPAGGTARPAVIMATTAATTGEETGPARSPG